MIGLKCLSIFVGILAVLIQSYMQSPLVTEPRNTAIRKGEKVTMRCASNDAIVQSGNLAWSHYIPQSSKEIEVFNLNILSRLVSSYISVLNSSKGNCNLQISTNTPEAAGTYVCSDTHYGKEHKAELIILDDHPKCTVITVDGNFNVTCSVHYAGNWPPTMQWIQVIGQNQSYVNAYETRAIPNHMVSSTIMMPTVNAVDEKWKDSKFQCVVKFYKSERPSTTNAINIPAYEWKSTVFGESGNIGYSDAVDSVTAHKVVLGLMEVVIGLIMAVVILLMTFLYLRERRKTENYRLILLMESPIQLMRSPASVQPIELPSTSVQPIELPSTSVQPIELPSTSVQPIELPSTSVQPIELPSTSVQPFEPPHGEQPLKKSIEVVDKD